MSVAACIAAAVEPVIHAAVALDAEAGRRVERLEGAVLEIRVSGLGLSLYVIPEGSRLRIAGRSDTQPAAVISGPPASLARLGVASGTSVLFGSEGVGVSGDVRVARAYKRLFDTLDPDWEEALARISGDIPAHETARLLRDVAAGFGRAASGRRQDLSAWLVDEIEALPGRGEVDAWLREVDAVRADSDRLDARVRRLERRLRDAPR